MVVRWCKIKYEKDGIDEDSVKFVYDNTLESSPLRQLVVDCYAMRTKSKLPQKFLEDLHNRLLQNSRIDQARDEFSGNPIHPFKAYYVTDETLD
jgi:hypothetical protein